MDTWVDPGVRAGDDMHVGSDMGVHKRSYIGVHKGSDIGLGIEWG